MYKYIKGITIVSEKKMPNSLEIAEEYGFWMPSPDSLVPNGTLVDFVIKAYLEQNNHKTSEYYYMEDYKISFHVYPEEMVKVIMDNFLEYLKENNIVPNRDSVYMFNNISFIYYESPTISGKVIDFKEYKRRKEVKNNDQMP